MPYEKVDTKRIQIGWLGYMERTSRDRQPKIILYGELGGVRRVGTGRDKTMAARGRSRFVKDENQKLKVHTRRGKRIVDEVKVHVTLWKKNNIFQKLNADSGLWGIFMESWQLLLRC